MDRVTDLQLYPYLIRLAVLANRLTEDDIRRRDEDAASVNEELQNSEVITFNKLPRGTLKALMTYFKQLALDKQATAVDPTLKRTYLAFYTQLLDLKVTDPDQFEEVIQRTELLILKFTACVTKVAGQPLVDSQGAQFMQLLRVISRKQGGNAQLDAQLAAREAEFCAEKTTRKPRKQKISKPGDTEYVSEQISKVMLVSPVLFDRDLAKESSVTLHTAAKYIEEIESMLNNGAHPIYEPQDFARSDLWHKFVSDETAQLREMKVYLPDQYEIPSVSISSSAVAVLIPPHIRAYFSAFLERCIEADLKESTLFTNKTKSLIKFVCQFWRIPIQTYIPCLLYAVSQLYHKKVIPVSTIDDAYGYSKHIASSEEPWPASDRGLALHAIESLRADLTGAVIEIFQLLLTPSPPKFGPILHAITINLPLFADIFGISEREYLIVTPHQIGQVERSIITSAETDYDKTVSRIPRDSTLDIEDVVKLVQSIVQTAQKLQKKYKRPMFDRLPIAKIVCARQITLLSQDFEPIWKFCMKQYRIKEEEPPFESMIRLHEELLLLQDLSDQVRLPAETFSIDPEELLFPYFEKWATESANMCLKWVKPAIDHDNNQPLDPGSGKMYSSAVKDLFSSFYASVSLIDKMDWNNQFHMARLLTTMVGGIASALCQWSSQIHELFMDEMAQASSQIPVPPLKLKAKDQEEQWFVYAKEATAQAAAAVIARSSKPSHTFDFKRESGIKLNNISAAYEMLQQMESQLNSDAVSKRLRDFQAKNRITDQSTTRYLFNVTIIGASDIKHSNRGLYLTLVDHDTRKQLGKTHVSSESGRPKWNESFEFEVGGRPRLLRATVWSYGSSMDHEVCGRVMIRLDAKQYVKKEYGMQLKWIDLEGGSGKLHVMFTVDQQFDDIRFHFGKALRFIKRTQDMMVTNIVAKFSEFIHFTLSRQTLKEVTGQGSIANSVQTGVSQLQKSFNSWLGKPLTANSAPVQQQETVQDLVDKSLEPLYDYLNKNFATLAGVLTPELRIEVLSRTWDVVLEALESLILPPMESTKTTQTQLNSAEMEALYMWLTRLREFFHSDGAGPSLERLQSQNYQQIMTIPVYYDLPTSQLKTESEKVVRSSLRSIASNTELLARQGTVMAHRNKSVIEHQVVQLQNAQRNSPKLDDIILRILRLRGEIPFIEQHMKYRDRLMQQEMTEKALQGSLF